MDTDEYLDQLRIEGGRLVTAARAAPSVPVPSCPEWDMGQLLAHIEAIHRWVAEILATKATARVTRIGVGDDVGFADLAAAYDAGLAALVAAFEVTDPAEPVWNWSADAPAPAAFWFRRMAQETSVHRWDAEAAAGTPTAIDAALAVDGVDEYLGFVARYVAVHPIEELASTLSLVADDAGRSWRLGMAPDRLTADDPQAAQATVTAAASDLYLWLLHRTPRDPAAVTVAGDPGPVAAWGHVIFD
ncbi:MAG: maleylpyruvate isomerase family mycothiol-dependent enzyme [Acidimicrobiales bacterium]